MRNIAFLSPLCLVWFSNQLIKQWHSRWWKAVLMSTLNFILPSWGSTFAIKMDRWQKEREGIEMLRQRRSQWQKALKLPCFWWGPWSPGKLTGPHKHTEPHYCWHLHWGTTMQKSQHFSRSYWLPQKQCRIVREPSSHIKETNNRTYQTQFTGSFSLVLQWWS